MLDKRKTVHFKKPSKNITIDIDYDESSDVSHQSCQSKKMKEFVGNYDMILNMWEMSKSDESEKELEKKPSTTLITRNSPKDSPTKERPIIRNMSIRVDSFKLDI